MINKYYYLIKDGEVVEAKDVIEWSEWIERVSKKEDQTFPEGKIVGYTELHIKVNDDLKKVRVSTIFLSLNHNFSRRKNAKPILFETMVFLGDTWRDMFCKRSHTVEQARKIHRRVVSDLVKNKIEILYGLTEES